MTDERESLDKMLRKEPEIPAEPVKIDSDMSVEVIKKSRILKPWQKKEVLCSVADGNRKKILDCFKERLKGVSNALLSPYQDKVAFAAEDFERQSRDIYVVNANGKNLVRLTNEGEAAYLGNPDDLRWVSPVKFRYAVPADISHTYEFRCRDECHVHEVTLNNDNCPFAIDSYYYDGGQLVKESFTPEEIDEAFSRFFEIFEDYAKDYRRFNERLKRGRKRAEKQKKETEESQKNPPKGIPRGLFTIQALNYIQQISNIDGMMQAVQTYIDMFNEQRADFKELPKEADRIGKFRAYLGFLKMQTKRTEYNLGLTLSD
jgi:hypothetical protein